MLNANDRMQKEAYTVAMNFKFKRKGRKTLSKEKLNFFSDIRLNSIKAQFFFIGKKFLVFFYEGIFLLKDSERDVKNKKKKRIDVKLEESQIFLRDILV